MDPAPNPYGNIVEVRKPWPWKWGKERLLNEAYALNLVKEYTTIPVPRLLDYGVDDQGRTFVTMERPAMPARALAILPVYSHVSIKPPR
jgi:hypothetical protein